MLRRRCSTLRGASSAELGAYASLCVAAGIPPLQLSRFMGHGKVTTKLAIYCSLRQSMPVADGFVGFASVTPPLNSVTG